MSSRECDRDPGRSGGREGLDDPALRYRAAAALREHPVQFLPERGQIGDLALDVREMAARDLVHRFAGPGSVVRKIQQRPDLLGENPRWRARRMKLSRLRCSGS